MTQVGSRSMAGIRYAAALLALALIGAGPALARQVNNGDGTVTPTMTLEASTTPGPVPVTSTGSVLTAKGSAANLYGYSFTQGGTAGFFAILNTTVAPAANAAITPLECVPVPANGYVARRQGIPDRYGAGLVIVSTSSCTTYTAVTPVLISVVVQ